MISHMLSIYDLLVLTDSEDECPERDDSRPLDHDEEIDILTMNIFQMCMALI